MVEKYILLLLALMPIVYTWDNCGPTSAYCEHGCCEDEDGVENCCYYDEGFGENSSLSTGALVGLIIGIAFLKLVFWSCCCWIRIRRRHRLVVVRRVALPQTTVTVRMDGTNPAHAGYDQRPQRRMSPINPAHAGYDQRLPRLLSPNNLAFTSVEQRSISTMSPTRSSATPLAPPPYEQATAGSTPEGYGKEQK